MQRRIHPRVRLRLAARLRWSAPLGQRTEECETINVSRGGVLLRSFEAHGVGHPVWVTMPFDPAAPGPQPETLARVVRCMEADKKSHWPWNVAMRFEGLSHFERRRNGNVGAAKSQNGAGNKVSLLIRVRPQNVPWGEDTMTVEVSRDTLKFVTNREYGCGQRLLIAFATGNEGPWGGDQEWTTQVTGVETEGGSESLRVTVKKRAQ